MKLAGNQPYFLPYISYWQLINASDVFLIGDDYAFIRHGWINRNRILLNGAPHYFGITVEKSSSFKLCNQLHIAEIDKRQKINKLYEAYHKAPYYEVGIKLIEEILNCPETILSEFLLSSIKTICRYLGIDTPILKTSELAGNSSYIREERIYDICHRFGADTYINLIGGMSLYDVNSFAKKGLKLQFLKRGNITYPQFKYPFVDNLSILDVIMFNSIDDIYKMLNNYEFV